MGKKTSSPYAAIGRRARLTLLPAATGALFGTLYARRTLPEAFLSDQTLMAVYAAAGAASAILLVRVFNIVRVIVHETWISMRADRAGRARPVEPDDSDDPS